MKKFLILIVLLFSGFYLYFNHIDTLDELTYMTNKAMFDFSNIQFKKRNLTLFGFGCRKSKEPNKLEELFLDYSTKNELTIGLGRKLLIEITQEFIESINNDNKMEKYLSPYPFDFHNVRLSLAVTDPIDGRKYYPEGLTEKKNISYLFLDEGRITYFINPSLKQPMQKVLQESYEDALKILKENNEI